MRCREFQQLAESLSTLSPHQFRQMNECAGELAQQNDVRTLMAEHVQRDGLSVCEAADPSWAASQRRLQVAGFTSRRARHPA